MQITYFDRDGKEVKRVTSTDGGDVEDNKNTQPSNGGSQNQGGNQGGGNQGGGNESNGD